MATKTTPNTNPDLTVAVPKAQKVEEPRVRVLLPLLEDDGSGVTVDQYEHVSISNESGDNFVRVKRGEYVDVTVPVFLQLKQRYPNL